MIRSPLGEGAVARPAENAELRPVGAGIVAPVQPGIDHHGVAQAAELIQEQLRLNPLAEDAGGGAEADPVGRLPGADTGGVVHWACAADATALLYLANFFQKADLAAAWASLTMVGASVPFFLARSTQYSIGFFSFSFGPHSPCTPDFSRRSSTAIWE